MFDLYKVLTLLHHRTSKSFFSVTEVSSSTFGWHVLPYHFTPSNPTFFLHSSFFFFLFLSSLCLINLWLPEWKGILIILPTLTQMHLTTVINVHIYVPWPLLLLFNDGICLACNFRFIHINCLPFCIIVHAHYCFPLLLHL